MFFSTRSPRSPHDIADRPSGKSRRVLSSARNRRNNRAAFREIFRTRARLVLARCHCRRRKRARFSEGHVCDELEVSRLSLMSPRFVSRTALRNILTRTACGVRHQNARRLYGRRMAYEIYRAFYRSSIAAPKRSRFLEISFTASRYFSPVARYCVIRRISRPAAIVNSRDDKAT